MLPLDTTEVNSFMMIRQFHVVHSKADFIFIQNTHHTLHIWGKTGQPSGHLVQG